MAKLVLIAPTCNGEDVGEAWVAFQWASRLAARHQVTLLTYHKKGARPAREQLPGVDVVEWDEPGILGYAERFNSIVKPGYVPFYRRARHWLRQKIASGEKFDVVHQPVPVAMRYPSPAAGLGIPLVLGPVGGGLMSPAGFAEDETTSPWFMGLRKFDGFRLRFDPMLRATYESAACVLGIAAYVEEQLATLKLKRFEIMSETGLDGVAEPIDRSGREGPVRVLYVGRLVRTKGARDIIRAMGTLTDLPLHLDVVGDGPDRQICASLVSELGLQKSVTLHGWKSKEDVAGFYRRSDMFVFPSYREAGGNVALEAMAHSLPLIVVDRGGPGSATTPACAIKLQLSNPDGLLRDLSAGIRRLATDAALRERMGQAGREHVASTALWSAKLDRMDEIYRDVIAAR